MKFVHISDLHLGKRLNHVSMMEEQRYILCQITDIVEETKSDALLIAGDVYDRPSPPSEAVALFDDFLAGLAEKNCSVFVISGNHDSPERIAFASRLTAASGVYLSPVFSGEIKPVVIQDEYGPLNVYMIPFIRPLHVRHCVQEDSIKTYTDALRYVIEHLQVDFSQRNVLMAHQFVTGASQSGSEEISVGGLDNVDAEVFSDFDYVALGHIHRAQEIGGGQIRYSGTPLKYSFSEAGDKKSVTVVEIKEKGKLLTEEVLLTPRHDLMEIRGTFDEVMHPDFYRDMDVEAYLRITLSDEMDIPNAFHKLCTVYPNLMYMDYERRGAGQPAKLPPEDWVENKSPLDFFAGFYQKMNRSSMTAEQETYMREKINKIWSEDDRERNGD